MGTVGSVMPQRRAMTGRYSRTAVLTIVVGLSLVAPSVMRAQAPGPPGVGGAPGGAPGAPGAAGGQQQATTPRTNSVTPPLGSRIVVRGPPGQLEAIDRVMRDFDRLPRQVLLDMAILDVNFTRNDTAGVNFRAFFGATRPGFNLPLGGFSSDLAGTGTQTLRYGSLGTERFNLFFQFLKNHTKTRVLSRPSILVIDGQQARIQVGGTTRFVEGTERTLTAGGGVAVTTRIGVVDTGPTLAIAPRIFANDIVLLNINFEDQTIVNFEQFGTDLRLPTTRRRSVRSPFYLKSGHALIIGGLISARNDRESEKIPVLGHLPFVGRNFGRNRRADAGEELVIVIKATVMSDRDFLE